MRLISLSLIASALISLAHAQAAQLPIPCCDVDIFAISNSDRQSYCQANLNSCTEACSKSGSTDNRNNQCNSDSLTYICRCNDGAQPDLRPFAQTVPGLKCQFWYGSCISGSTNNEERSACTAAKNSTCGSRTDPENALQAQSSASASATGSGLVSSSSSRPLVSQGSLVRTATSSATRSRASSSPSSSPSSTGGVTTESQDSGTPVGTIVGAVVGTVGGIVVILIVGWCVFRRRRQRKQKNVVENVDPMTGYEKAELHGTPTSVHHTELPAGDGREAYPYLARNVELGGDAKLELHGDGRRNSVSELHLDVQAGQLSASDSVRVGARG